MKQNTYPWKIKKKKKMANVLLSKVCRSKNICILIKPDKNTKNPL